MPQDNATGLVGKGIALVGFALIFASFMILFQIYQTVTQILNDPTQVPVVKFLMDKIGQSDDGIFGNLDGKKFEVHLGEPLRYMLYVIMGAMALGILARVFSGLISAGSGMFKAGMSLQAASPGNSDKPPVT